MGHANDRVAILMQDYVEHGIENNITGWKNMKTNELSLGPALHAFISC
jgi:hypothetical protein